MLNTITIMGRLTKDPDLRYTQSQKPVASFTLAVDRDFGDKQTDFIDCVAWNKTAEFVQKYFHKGSMAVATGRLQLRDWTDKDGNKRRNAEVVAEHVYFGESKNTQNATLQITANTLQSSYRDLQNAAKAPQFVEMDDDGELPF